MNDQTISPESFKAVAEKISEATGYVLRLDEKYHYPHASFFKDGKEFYVRVPYNFDKFDVSGSYPRDLEKQTCVSGEEWDVRVRIGIQKNADQVAADIARRFLPLYEEKYGAALKIVETRNQEIEKRMGIVKRIGDILGSDNVKESSFYSHSDLFFIRGQVLSWGRIDFEINDCSIEDFKKIMNILKNSGRRTDEFTQC